MGSVRIGGAASALVWRFRVLNTQLGRGWADPGTGKSSVHSAVLEERPAQPTRLDQRRAHPAGLKRGNAAPGPSRGSRASWARSSRQATSNALAFWAGLHSHAEVVAACHRAVRASRVAVEAGRVHGAIGARPAAAARRGGAAA